MKGCSKDANSLAYIENTNEFPVRVRQAWVFNSAELTQALYRLQPHERVDFPHVSLQERFYIYDLNGAIIGFFIGACPKSQ
jgi:hypothetical protein